MSVPISSPILRSIASPLREALARANYSHASVQELLGISQGGFVDLSSGPLAMWRTQGDSPLATLVRLFVLGATVGEDRAAEVLAPLGLDAALHGGLVRRAGDPSGRAVEATIALVPFEDLVLAADFSLRPDGPLQPSRDHVMGVGRSTVSLSRLAFADLAVTDPRQASPLPTAPRVLDLGCGCGYLALRASKFARSAIGTDLNPRAIELATFSAALNTIDHAEFREGSLIDPVVDDRFDLIVSNPPFVISPESSLIYRDGGITGGQSSDRSPRTFGDEFCQAVASQAPCLLSQGGTMVMLMNWAHAQDQPWEERLASWAPPSMQRWVIRTDTQSVDEYASMWIRHTMSGDNDWSQRRYFELFDSWMAYYDLLGIDRISYGAMVVRNSSPAFFTTDDIDSRWVDAGAISLARSLEGRAIVHAHDPSGSAPEALLPLRWKPAPDVRVVQASAPPDSTWRPSTVTVTLGPLGRPIATAAPSAVDAVLRSTGRRTLASFAVEAAAALGVSGEERSTLLARIAHLARAMAREGALIPVA